MEWQLASTDLGAVHRWLSEHERIDGLVLEPRTALKICDTYLDTDDWRIHRAGFALRIRSESGRSEATLKSLHSAGDGPADRRELSEPLPSGQSESIRRGDGPVGSRVQAVSGDRTLVPLFEVRTSRQRFAVRKERESAQLGEIALDETVISRPDGDPRASMQRVEVEALTEILEPLESLVRTMRSNCALEAAGESKFSQGLKSVGLAPAPPPEFAPATVDAAMTMMEVALANLRRQLSAWNRHEPAARLGDDPEELHDLRLAGRRTDALLRQFQPYLPEACLRIRPTLKEVLRALGEVRDLDVALAELQSFCRELPPAERESAEPLMRHLRSERVLARDRMLGVLDSAGVQQQLREWAALLAAPVEERQRNAAQLAVNHAPKLIRRRYRKVCKGAQRLGPKSRPETYHEVRGRLKKLRYAIEAVAEIYGKPAEEMLRVLRRWQEKLGMQQDAFTAAQRLKTLAAAPPVTLPAATLFLMGRLAEHHATAIRRLRKLQAKGYRKVRGRYKRLRMKLDDAMISEQPIPASQAPAT